MAGAPREKIIVEQVRAVLRRRGCFFWKTSPGSYGTPAGMTDFACVYRGLFVGLEVKRPVASSKLNPAQVRQHAAIRAAGGLAETVTSAAEAEAVLDGIDARLGPRAVTPQVTRQPLVA